MLAKRRRCLVVVFVLFSVLPTAMATATLEIERFDVDIVLETSGQLAVTEEITVRYFSPHHGIERFITISGQTPWGETVTIDLELDEILMDNAPVPYTLRTRSGHRIARIGDPDRTITGTHTYTIVYRVQRALLFSDNAIRLYWNVTGHDWDIPIRQATATVHLPLTVDLAAVAYSGYSGYFGSTSQEHVGVATTQRELLFESGALVPGEGLTVVVTIPRDVLPIDPPSAWQRLLWLVQANWFVALPLLTFAGMFLLWRKLGKDPRKRVIAPAFAPPRDIHPGAAGVLIDDRIDLRDISAMLVGLAVNGHLTLHELDDGNYVFKKQREADESLSLAERTLFDTLFDTPETTERTLVSLEQEFYKSLPSIKSHLYSQLIDAGYYTRNPERVKSSYTTLGLMTLPLAIYLGIQASSLLLAACVALSGLVVLAFARFMPRKTIKGVRKLEEVLGLSTYIRRAEVDRIEFHNAPEKGPELFEKLLPYAIALNLTAVWTKQFKGLLNEPPRWYTGHSPATTFNVIRFSHTLSTMNRSMQRTFTSAPRTSGKSAWSGRSSFGGGFSGGGFSGGGFGGGGGKGW